MNRYRGSRDRERHSGLKAAVGKLNCVDENAAAHLLSGPEVGQMRDLAALPECRMANAACREWYSASCSPSTQVDHELELTQSADALWCLAIAS